MAVLMDIRVSNVRADVHLTAYYVTCTILILVFTVILDFMVTTVIRVVYIAKQASKPKHAIRPTEHVNMAVLLVTGVRCVLRLVRIGARVCVAMKRPERVLMDVIQRIMDSIVNMIVALTA